MVEEAPAVYLVHEVRSDHFFPRRLRNFPEKMRGEMREFSLLYIRKIGRLNFAKFKEEDK